jgi:serine/threonine protein phosphatase PrpC
MSKLDSIGTASSISLVEMLEDIATLSKSFIKNDSTRYLELEKNIENYFGSSDFYVALPIKKYSGRFSLKNGDMLFLYTDGVIEICNEQRQQYDIYRLEQFLLQHSEKNTEEIKQLLLEGLNEFKHEQTDDITFMVMKKI